MMKALKVLSTVAAAAVLVQLLGAAPHQATAADAKVIKIASQSPLSVKSVSLGTAISNGVRLAVKQAADHFQKDLGFTLQYQPYDDQGTADVGVSNATNIVNDQAILVVIGHLNSGVALPSSEKYNQADLAMISPANTNVKITDRGYPTVNRVCGRDDAQGGAGATYALKELKAKSAYIIDDTTPYGAGVAGFFRDVFANGGGNVLGFEETEEKSSFDAIITPLMSQNPDVVYYGGLYDQGGAQLLKQLRDKGYKGFFMGADGLDGKDMATIAGKAVVGLIYTSTGGPASSFADAKKFVDDYKAEFKIDPDTYGVQAYAATQIALAAIENTIKAGNGAMPTRKAVAAAIRATKDFPTAIGKITFDGNGDPAVAPYYIIKATSDDPTKWGDNQIIYQTLVPSPLTAKAQASGTMAATMAATMAPTMAK